MSRINKLKESRVKAREALKAVTDELDPILAERALTPDEEKRFEDARKHVADLDAAYDTARAERVKAKKEEEERAAKLGGVDVDSGVVRIGKEPLTYGPGNPGNSFARDCLVLSQPMWRDTEQGKRLTRHQQEMTALFNAGTGQEGRTVRAYAREIRRVMAQEEHRDVSTVATSMGDLAPPLYWLPQYAEYRTYGRTLIDAMAHLPMPATGLTFNLPKIVTPTEAVNQTNSTTQGNNENSTVTERTITSDYETGTLQTIIDNVLVSQQYLDRVGPGIDGDTIIRQDQQAQVNRTLNVYAWKKIIRTSGIGTVTYTGVTVGTATTPDVVFTAATFIRTLHKAKATMQKTDGTVAYPTHLFSTVDLWTTIEGSFDKNNRPFVTPQGVAFNPLAEGTRASNPEGYTGFRCAGLPSYIDQAAFVAWQTVKTSTDTEQTWHIALVGALDLAAYWIESTPVIRVLPQPYAKTLTVLIQEYVYCAYVPKYPKALQLVRGAGTKGTKLAA